MVSAAQLAGLGVSAGAVGSRLRRGRLHSLHRGVYAVGHPALPTRGRYMAAVLACGRSAALSHRSAADLWGLRRYEGAAVDVTTTRQAGRQRAGIDAHQSRTLEPGDFAVVEGIPCTTVTRTLLDLSDVVDRRALERAVDRAEMLALFDGLAVTETLGRASGRRGATLLRAVLADLGDPALTASELEERFLALCLEGGLPRPGVNVWLCLAGGFVQADFLWRAARLVVETDGRATHGTRAAFARDRRRDQSLLLAGFRVVRFSWREVTQEPARVLATVGRLLAG